MSIDNGLAKVGVNCNGPAEIFNVGDAPPLADDQSNLTILCNTLQDMLVQMRLFDGDDSDGLAVCNDFNPSPIEVFFEEYHRICHAIAATPANDLRALLIKKKAVEGFVTLKGSSATSGLLLRSFFDDFDRFISKRRFANYSMSNVASVVSILGDLVAISEGPLVETSLNFWKLWAAVCSRRKTFEENDDFNSDDLTDKFYEEELSDWVAGEQLARRLAAIPAYSIETLIIKRHIVGAWLDCSRAFFTPPPLLRSFFMDCDRVLASGLTCGKSIGPAALARG